MEQTLFKTKEPQTFDELRKAFNGLYVNGSTFQDYAELKNWAVNNPDAIGKILNTLTIDQLSRFTYSKDKKARMIKSVQSSFLQVLVFSDGFSYSPMEESFEAALQRQVSNYTEQDFLSYKAKKIAEREAKLKAINNPETLDEFRTFISYKGEKALTSEQRASYDSLIADTNKAHKQRTEEWKAEVKEVANVDAEMIIRESFHAKKQIPLWVVVLSNKVDRAIYDELNARAKQLGGYYSSFRGNGAIPGFTFEKEEAARLFMQVKDGNVNASELKAEIKEEKKQTKAESLREKGQKLQSEGDEEFSRDRQANTARRARFAASAEAKATEKIEFGKTLQKIADGIEAGTIKYLENVSSVKELDELDSILSRAKYAHCKVENLRSDNYEITAATVDHAQLPFPILYKSYASDLMQMADYPGKKLAAARMLKRLNTTAEFIEINSAQRIEDYETLFCQTSIGFDRYRVDRYKEILMCLKRVKRLGIESIHELRAALRELLQLRSGATLTEDQKKAQQLRELERKFLNTKIDGFFPTPEELAASIVRKARIEEGNTVLEPSAGLGHIADAISEAHPNNELMCIEIYQPLAEALKLKGYDVLNKDFLEIMPSQELGICFDRIIMNPPFENLQDCAHVLHAFALLKPGGRIVAIMANNKNGDRKQIQKFMELVDMYGSIEENPAGSFASAFRPTGVNTITVIIDKPF